MAQLLPDNLLDPLLEVASFDETISYGETWEFHFSDEDCGCDNSVYGSHLGVVNHRVSRLFGKATLKQWLTMMLATERYEWLIFDADYGAEFQAIIRASFDAEEATTEIKQTIIEALQADDRITEVTSVDIEEGSADSLIVDVRMVTFAGEDVDVLLHDIGGVEDL